MTDYYAMMMAKKEIEKTMFREVKNSARRIEHLNSAEQLARQQTKPELAVVDQQKRLIERVCFERGPEQRMRALIERLYQNGMTPEQWNCADVQERKIILHKAKDVFSQELNLTQSTEFANPPDEAFLTTQDAGSVYASLYQAFSQSEVINPTLAANVKNSESSAELLSKAENSYKDTVKQSFEKAYCNFSGDVSLGNLLTEHLNAEKTSNRWLSSLRRIEKEPSLRKNLKACNPNFKNAQCWKINCQRCVPTYEMRARGYDVTAKPRTIMLDHLSINPFDVWENAEIHTTTGDGVAEIEDFLKKNGEGTRVQIVALWKYGQGGHTFVAEMKNGVIRYLDPQSGKTNVRSHFNNVKPDSVRFCRMDNLRFSDKIVDCCEEVKRA